MPEAVSGAHAPLAGGRVQYRMVIGGALHVGTSPGRSRLPYAFNTSRTRGPVLPRCRLTDRVLHSSTGRSVQVCRYRSPLRPLLTAAQDGGSCGFWKVARYLSACRPSRRRLPRSKGCPLPQVLTYLVSMAIARSGDNAIENPGRVPGFFALGGAWCAGSYPLVNRVVHESYPHPGCHSTYSDNRRGRRPFDDSPYGP